MLVMTPRRPVKIRTEPKPKEEARPRAARSLDERLAEPISVWWALGVAATLVGANFAAQALEPAAANPDLPQPWFVVLPSTVAAFGILAALAGLLARRRWGMGASLLAAGIGLVMVVACPVSGHHHFGMWWIGELACLGAWAGVSVAGLRATRAGRA